MPLNKRMEPDYDNELSVIDVYDIASDIGKEFEKIIDCYGSEAIAGLVSKVIVALEHLEYLASKNERENSNIQDLEAKIMKLESDKLEKAEDRLRFERDLELIEEHWKKEMKDLESMVTKLQEENRKLKNALSDKKEMPAQQLTPEVDMASLQRLRGMVDQLRDNLRKAEKEISSKHSEVDELTGTVKRLSTSQTELTRKNRLMHKQVRGLVNERVDMHGQIHDLKIRISQLCEQLGEAQKDLYLTKPSDDSDKPKFTTTELKDILHERNNLKARVSDLEDELECFRPKQEPESPLEEDLTVQGPLPYEPDDAPWKRSDSGIRKFFRKLFSESNVTFLGSPKRSLSSLSKITLAGSDTTV